MKKSNRILKSFRKIFNLFCFFEKKERFFEKNGERLAFFGWVVYNMRDIENFTIKNGKEVFS